MPCSKTLLAERQKVLGERLSARDLADIAGADPFLCLLLLREAESRHSQRLEHETTTPLAAVMRPGADSCRPA